MTLGILVGISALIIVFGCGGYALSKVLSSNALLVGFVVFALLAILCLTASRFLEFREREALREQIERKP